MNQNPGPDPERPAAPPPSSGGSGGEAYGGESGRRQWGRHGAWPHDGFDPFNPRRKSVGLACFLSLMPGLGQVYVGFYQRGFLHIMTVAGTISLLNTRLPDALIPLLGMFLPFFWLYNIIDAGRRAAHYNHALEEGDAGLLSRDGTIPGAGGSMAGGMVLITVGSLLLLHTHYGFSLEWIEEWWPVAPIMFGVYLVIRALMDRVIPNGDQDLA